MQPSGFYNISVKDKNCHCNLYGNEGEYIGKFRYIVKTGKRLQYSKKFSAYIILLQASEQFKIFLHNYAVDRFNSQAVKAALMKLDRYNVDQS